EVSIEPEYMIHRVQAYMKEKFPGFTYRCNMPIIDCTEKYGLVTVKATSGDTFQGDQVVICNGNEFKLLFPAVYSESGQVVSKLQMMRTEPLNGIELKGNILTGLTVRRYESFATSCPSYNTVLVPERYMELKKWCIHILFKQATDN